MPRTVPKIVERFPKYRDEILRARFVDPALDEICRDYDRVSEALEQEEARRKGGDKSGNDYQELARLARELEHEVLSRIATYPTQGKER
jgi:hypothetical protein